MQAAVQLRRGSRSVQDGLQDADDGSSRHARDYAVANLIGNKNCRGRQVDGVQYADFVEVDGRPSCGSNNFLIGYVGRYVHVLYNFISARYAYEDLTRAPHVE